MLDSFKAAIAILGLLLLVLFAAWLVVGRTGQSSGSTPQAELQPATAPAPASRPDSAAPAATGTAGAGTATFALG